MPEDALMVSRPRVRSSTGGSAREVAREIRGLISALYCKLSAHADMPDIDEELWRKLAIGIDHTGFEGSLYVAVIAEYKVDIGLQDATLPSCH